MFSDSRTPSRSGLDHQVGAFRGHDADPGYASHDLGFGSMMNQMNDIFDSHNRLTRELTRGFGFGEDFGGFERGG